MMAPVGVAMPVKRTVRGVSAWGGVAGRRWVEMIVVAAMIAVPHTFVVIVASMLMFGIDALTPMTVIAFGGVVLMFSLILTAINYLSGAVAVPLHSDIAPVAAAPVDAAAAAVVPLATTMPPGLIERLPPRLATGRLLALEAEDHYIRVHTDLGHHPDADDRRGRPPRQASWRAGPPVVVGCARRR